MSDTERVGFFGGGDLGGESKRAPVYLIKIIKRPDGTAPAAIRDAWVGLQLIATQPPGLKEFDHINIQVIIGRKPFLVDKSFAEDILFSNGKLEALNWFHTSFPFDALTFGASEVEVVGQVDISSFDLGV